MRHMTAHGKKTCYYSLLITALFVGLYWLGKNVILPGVDSAYFSSINKFASSSGIVNIFSLGYSPFIAGFIIVEIFSLIIPMGRRMRRGGQNGRAKLNRAAMSISIVVCVIQSLSMALAMERTGALGSIQLVPSPGWSFRFLTCLTLTVGAVLVFYIAKLISWKGIANGFCILIAFDILTSTIRTLRLNLDAFQKMGPMHHVEYFGCVTVLLIILFAYCQRTATATVTTAESNSSVNFNIPVLPQGILPLVWAFSVFSLPSLISGLSVRGLNAQFPSFWPLLLVTTVLIVVFSAIGVVLFSSGKRIVRNLPPGVRLDNNFERLLRNKTIRGAFVLAGGSALLLILDSQFDQVPMPNYASLIFLVAIALDVIAQWKFSWKHGGSKALIELDNSHLASYLQNLLEKNHINSVVQAYHYRRLLFFLGPLTKMRILVASDENQQARELIDWKSLQII
jgi:preprotein translocase subunit SecY